MVTEVININIIESGSRVVKRTLDDIGNAADRATRSLYLIQRALFVLGAGGIIRGLANLLDTLTNYENRLRLTATSTANMEGVQQRLFEVAQRSRTEFSAVADIYSRTALSARNLGLSQQEVLDITESLSKAALLSGANSREANAALVQLSQGLASNRLGGDELRSILEQLPYVADIIAKYLTSTGKFGQVGRGELRQLGKEGKLTASIIAEAFKASKTEIDTAFANTQVTIEQSVTNVGTAFLKLLDHLDDTYGISIKVANGIQFLADNMDNIARSAGVATTAIVLFYGAFKFNALLTAFGLLQSYYGAIKAGTYAVSGSIQAELARTEALVAQAGAYEANTLATFQNAQMRVANLRLSQQQAAQTVLDTEFTVVNGRARSVSTGLFVSATRAAVAHNTALSALQVTTNSLTASEARLTAATVALTGAQQASAAATAQAGIASAAASTRWGAFALRFPMLSAGVSKSTGLLRGLFSLVTKNPLTALIAALVTATVGLYFFGDKIHIAAGSLVTLNDIAATVFSNILIWLAPIGNAISQAFSDGLDLAMQALDLFNTAFIIGAETIFLGFITIAENTWGLFIGTVAGVKAAFIEIWNNFPAAFELIFVNAVNLAIAAIQFLINTTSAPLQGLLGAIDYISGKNLAGTFFQNTQIPTLKASADAEQVGKNVAGAFVKGFNEGRTQVDDAVKGVTTAVDGAIKGVTKSVMAGATTRAQDRAADAALIAKAQALNGATTPTNTGTPGGSGGKGKGGGNTEDFFQQLLKEIEALKQYGQQSRILQEIEKGEKALKRSMTEQEKAYTAELVKKLDVAKQEHEILNQLRTPQEDMAIRLAAVNNLFREGKLSIQEYRLELAKVASMGAEGGGFMAGVRAGLGDVAAKTEDFGKNVANWVVGSFESASNAITEFAKTGTLDIRQFFQDIFANLLKLMTNQIFSQLVSGMFTGGGAGGGGGGGWLAGLGSFLGFAGGGDFKVGGAGGTDSQLVAFRASPDERVKIMTPEQQRRDAMAESGGGGGGVQVMEPKVNVQIVNEDDPHRALSAMKSDAGTRVIMNTIRKNPDAIKRLLR